MVARLIAATGARSPRRPSPRPQPLSRKGLPWPRRLLRRGSARQPLRSRSRVRRRLRSSVSRWIWLRPPPDDCLCCGLVPSPAGFARASTAFQDTRVEPEARPPASLLRSSLRGLAAMNSQAVPSEEAVRESQVTTLTQLLSVLEEQALKQFDIILSQQATIEHRARQLDTMNLELLDTVETIGEIHRSSRARF